MLTASGKAIEFAGFRRAYVEGSDDPAAELEEQEAILPQCKVGDRIHSDGSTAVTLLGTEPKRHETSPPARFTEASLIKELERLGIGRPSTYAPTIATIVRRGYVFRQGKALVPSFTAFAVTKLLRDHFGDFVETDFTAEMEDDLDEISRGERESIAFLKQFYYGDKKHRGLLPAVEKGAENADYPLLDLGTDAESGEPVRDPDRTVRPVRAGGGRRARPDGVAARRRRAGGSDGRKGDGAGAREGRRAAHPRRRSRDRPERLRDERAIRRLRAARRDAGTGAEGQRARVRRRRRLRSRSARRCRPA